MLEAVHSFHIAAVVEEHVADGRVANACDRLERRKHKRRMRTFHFGGKLFSIDNKRERNKIMNP